MTTLHSIGRRSLLALAAILAIRPAAAPAAIFSTELDLAVTPGDFGPRFTADYDFKTAFAEVRSVRLELNLPVGFQGIAATTGNSSLSRSLVMQVYDPSLPPSVWYVNDNLGASAMNVPPSLPATFEFRRFRIVTDGPPTFTDWPPFLLTGRGAVSFTDVTLSSTHTLPSGDIVSTTVAWNAPDEIKSARLIIDADPIPEPTAAALALIAAASLANSRLRIYRRTARHLA